MYRQKVNQFREPWCENCGGNHWTQNCYYSHGFPTDYYEEPSRLDVSPAFHEFWMQEMDRQDKQASEQRKQEVEQHQFDLKEAEELILRTEKLGAIVDELYANFRKERSLHNNDLTMDRDTKDEIEVQPPFPCDELLQNIELEPIMDEGGSALPNIYMHIPPPMQPDYDFVCFDDTYINCDEFIDTGTVDELEDADEIEEECVPSWEEEFGDELLDIHLGDVGVHDPLGDLAELEELLFGEPKREIEEVGETEEVVEEMMQPLQIEYSRPLEDIDGGSPPLLEIPREKARRSRDRQAMRVIRWSHKDHRMQLDYRIDRFPHYLPHIRFGPGRFKDRWVDTFTLFRECKGPAITFFPTDRRRRRLSKTSGKRIKEKPPD